MSTMFFDASRWGAPGALDVDQAPTPTGAIAPDLYAPPAMLPGPVALPGPAPTPQEDPIPPEYLPPSSMGPIPTETYDPFPVEPQYQPTPVFPLPLPAPEAPPVAPVYPLPAPEAPSSMGPIPTETYDPFPVEPQYLPTPAFPTPLPAPEAPVAPWPPPEVEPPPVIVLPPPEVVPPPEAVPPPEYLECPPCAPCPPCDWLPSGAGRLIQVDPYQYFPSFAPLEAAAIYRAPFAGLGHGCFPLAGQDEKEGMGAAIILWAVLVGGAAGIMYLLGRQAKDLMDSIVKYREAGNRAELDSVRAEVVARCANKELEPKECEALLKALDGAAVENKGQQFGVRVSEWIDELDSMYPWAKWAALGVGGLLVLGLVSRIIR